MNNKFSQKSNQDDRGGFSFRAVVKGIIKGVILTIVLYLIGSIVVKHFDLAKTLIPSIAWWMLIIGICFGGISASKIAGSKGWLHGAFTGLIIIIIATAVNFIFFRNFSISSVLIKSIIGIVVGIIGGIIGINL